MGFAAGCSSGVVITTFQIGRPLIQAPCRWRPGYAGLAAGAGWMKEEFKLLGVPFEDRGRLTYLAAACSPDGSARRAFQCGGQSVRGTRSYGSEPLGGGVKIRPVPTRHITRSCFGSLERANPSCACLESRRSLAIPRLNAPDVGAAHKHRHVFLVIAVLYAPASDGLPVEVAAFADKEKAVVKAVELKRKSSRVVVIEYPIQCK
jgi:hypothetical protein